MKSQITWRPGPNDPRDCMVVFKGDDIILEPLDLNGFGRGFNSKSGASGLVPLFLFEGNTLAFDIGSSLILANFEKELARFPSRVMLGSNSWIKSIKRFMTKPKDDQYLLFGAEVLDELHPTFSYEDQSLTVLEILQILLEKAKKASEESEAQSDEGYSSRIVFPVPYLWNYYQKLLLRQAALNSGFLNVEFVHQNIAAAIYHHQAILEMQLILVISVGAYYTDISLILNTAEKLETLGKYGIQVGGSDATKLLFSRVKKELNLSLSYNDTQDRQLYNECELGKVNLLTMNSTRIPVGPGLDYLLSREAMTEIQAPVLRKINTGIENCFLQANKQMPDIQSVLLSGEAVPILDPILPTFSATIKVSNSSMVIGAARFAHRKLTRLCDSRYFHFGIGVGEKFIPVLCANDSTIKYVFISPLPGKSAVYINVYEGNYLRADRNLPLTCIQIDWFPFFDQTVLQVAFEITTGIVKVTVSFGQLILNSVVINNVDQVVFFKSHKLEKIESFRIAREMDYQNLLCAPHRDEQILSPTDIYFNSLIDMYTVAETFAKKVSKELVDSIVKKFRLHLNLITIWTKITETWGKLNQVSMSVSEVKFKIDQLLARLSDALKSETLAFGRLNELDTEFNSAMVSLNAIELQLGEFKAERKSMIMTCENCINLCNLITGKSKGHIGTGGSLSNTLFSIINLMDSIPTQLPLYISSQLLSHVQALFKNMTSLSSTYASVELDDHIRGLIPAERASYAKLVNISTQIHSYINEHHMKVLKTPLILSEGQVKPQDNKDCYIYEEYLLKALIQLDNVSIHDQASLRLTRKSIVNFCQAHLNQVDSLKSLHKAHQ